MEMEKIQNELHREKKYRWFELIIKEWDNYELIVWDVKWRFICKTPEDFIQILKITKKMLSTYERNKEDDKFYIADKNINWQIYEDLDLDDWILFDTTYLTDKWISEYIWDNNLQNYVKFINSLIESKFIKEWKNINIKKLENLIKESYKSQIDSLYNKNNLILKKEFEKYSFYELYNKLFNWWNPWLLKKIVSKIKKWEIGQSILSSVLLNSLIKNGYKIKERYDFIDWNNYSNNQELNYFKNLLSKDFKVKFFDKDYNKNIEKLKFIKAKNIIKIIWKTKDWEKIDVGEIQMDNFYADIIWGKNKIKEINESKEVKKNIDIQILWWHIVWEWFVLWEEDPQKYNLNLLKEKIQLDTKRWIWKIYIKNKEKKNVAVITYFIMNKKWQKYVILSKAPMEDKAYDLIVTPLEYNRTIKLNFKNKKDTKTYEKEVWNLVLEVKFEK